MSRGPAWGQASEEGIGGLSPLTADEIRGALEVVLINAGLDRAPRLQDFLRYICDMTLRGEGSRINESLIAIEVFGRGDDYSPGDDSIVRRQAHALRQKMLHYYLTKGEHDPIRIDLPVGRYVPVFVRTEPAPAQPPPQARAPEATPKAPEATTVAAKAAEPEPQPPEAVPATPEASPASDAPEASPTHPQPITPSGAQARRAALVIAAGATVFSAGFLLGRRRRPTSDKAPARKMDPALAAFWGPWLDPSAGVTICLSNPAVGIVKRISDPASPSIGKGVLVPAEAPGIDRLRKDLAIPTDGNIYLYGDRRNHTKLGETIGAIRMAQFFVAAGIPVRTTQSRLLTAEGLRRDSVIMMGGTENNQWVTPLLQGRPLRLGSSASGQVITDTRPAAGQPAEYVGEEAVGALGAGEEVVLVSLLPGLAEGHQLLLISSSSSPAAEGAAELLTDARGVADVLAALGADARRDGKGPAPFQAVLRVKVTDKRPVQTSIAVLRVL